ncbi:cytochrome-c peroxidase [Pleionea sediminis]|uniref:cytochrome-c peroxidase n=1 Tax=Pleionea sediminis TaxID=2569479 RepID=UPI001186238F|nr:cytochrome c peroxidase [Pleionea sediminis]
MRYHLLKYCGIFVVSGLLFACGSSSDSDTSDISDDPDIPDEPVEMTILSDGTEVPTAQLVEIGSKIFNDTSLSTPPGQSCASCHSPDSGFDDPNDSNPTSLGADGMSFGTRNSPTASYAAHIPDRHLETRQLPNGDEIEITVGGLFWDGRAVSLEEQAKGPFLNPIEMGNASEQAVIDKLVFTEYASDFEALFGNNVLQDTERAYDYIADAIAAFERTEIFSPATSKFDRVLAGNDTFTDEEDRGHDLFFGRAQCDTCHSNEDGGLQVFSNFEYHNIGVPKNSMLPALLEDPSFLDLGLGEITNNPRDDGRFRVPNLRNIANTAPYMHNGVFNTLEEVVDFYNTRDTDFGEPPEVNRNVDNGGNIGELELSDRDIADLIAFLNTLSDE